MYNHLEDHRPNNKSFTWQVPWWTTTNLHMDIRCNNDPCNLCPLNHPATRNPVWWWEIYPRLHQGCPCSFLVFFLKHKTLACLHHLSTPEFTLLYTTLTYNSNCTLVNLKWCQTCKCNHQPIPIRTTTTIQNKIPPRNFVACSHVKKRFCDALSNFHPSHHP